MSLGTEGHSLAVTVVEQVAEAVLTDIVVVLEVVVLAAMVAMAAMEAGPSTTIIIRLEYSP
jgi:hypothetical protein